jgi:cell division protein FtsA
MEEILEIVAIEIKRSGYSSQLSAGVVITGGGSLLQGICPLANEILGMDAKIGIPGGLTDGLVNEVKSPIYATGVGLVMHAIKTNSTQGNVTAPAKGAKSGEDLMDRIASTMKNWFKEF